MCAVSSRFLLSQFLQTLQGECIQPRRYICLRQRCFTSFPSWIEEPIDSRRTTVQLCGSVVAEVKERRLGLGFRLGRVGLRITDVGGLARSVERRPRRRPSPRSGAYVRADGFLCVVVSRLERGSGKGAQASRAAAFKGQAALRRPAWPPKIRLRSPGHRKSVFTFA